jgi:nucleoside-diphosphate-sugar epimerase
VKNIIVTGAAGFIGSHLCRYLLQDKNNKVTGIDCFTNHGKDRYSQLNTLDLNNSLRFQLAEEDLTAINWKKHLADDCIVYHLAGMPGVRSSWGSNFSSYVTNNISVTQRLLEACSNFSVDKFIFASTSSVYGEKTGKVSEQETTMPLSPYGVTKLTGEHLCKVYEYNENIPLTILRYFTVYGPGQRPDMAFHNFIKAILKGDTITVYGDGTQTRDFTYIDDCVKGTAAVMSAAKTKGEIFNIGGKERASVNEVIAILEELTGKKANVKYTEKQKGEPLHTWADISKAEETLNYKPGTTLREGLKKQAEYIKTLYKYNS